MALRLIDSPAAPQPLPSLPLARRLELRAQALMAHHDLAGWRGLFAEAAAEEDPHRRYQAQARLLDTALAVSTGTSAKAAERFCAMASAAIDVLEAEPAEPVLLNKAGVAFYELGALEPAQALFAAAQRLDRDLPHVARNLDEVRRRRQRGITQLRGLPAPVVALLKRLTPRALRVARAARPARGLTLSLCMIVKDEEAMLARCLEAVRAAVDEIVIVDTGSTDRTVEIATSFGARVLHHAWTGDFAAARNVSFDAATGDWLLYLDADEVLVADDAAKLRELTGRTWREAFYLVETNHTGAMEDGTAVTHNALRLFRNRPHYRFEGRIHEQIAQHLPAFVPERLEVAQVRIEHFGYLGVVREAKAKTSRNIELLERQAAEGDDTAFLHFNLGSEHAAAGNAPKALEHFARAWELLEDDPARRSYGFMPSLGQRLVTALRICGDVDEGERRAEQVLALLPGFTDVVLEQGQLAKRRGDLEAAKAKWRLCLEMGDAPSAYSATVGAGSYLATAALADALQAEGDLAGAEELLRGSLAAHPSFIGTAERLAQVLLRRGVAPAEVVAQIHDGVAAVTPAVRFLVAVPLYEAGAVAEAEAELRGVLAAQPGADAARAALAEALLSQGRLMEAAEAAEAVADGSPVEPAAVRTAVFARLAQGDPDADGVTASVLSRAKRVLPAHEHAVLATWAGAGTGDAALQPAAAELVLTMLDALARLERFESFERLVAVFVRLGLPWREQRERLARLYLRRGFLESAADEWIAVCTDRGPDPAAFAGLAEVAALRGHTEDAEMFTREAQALAGAA